MNSPDRSAHSQPTITMITFASIKQSILDSIDSVQNRTRIRLVDSTIFQTNQLLDKFLRSIIGSPRFIIPRVTLDDAGDSITVSGELQLELSEFPRTNVSLTAADSDEGADLTITLTPPDGSVFVLNNVIDSWLQLFDLPTPPSMPALELRELSATVNTTTQTYSFRGESAAARSIPLGDASFEVDTFAEMAISRNTATGRRQFTGSVGAALEISAGVVADLEFRLDEAGEILLGGWRADDDLTLSFNELLQAMQIDVVELPDEIDPELHAFGFEFDAAHKSMKLIADADPLGRVFFVTGRRPGATRWESIFGVEFPRDAALSDLPVIRDELGDVDLPSFKQTALIISTKAVKDRPLPVMPRLSSDEETEEVFLSDTGLDLAQGLNLAAVIDLNDNAAVAADGGIPGLLDNLHTEAAIDTLTIQGALGTSALSFRTEIGGEVSFGSGGDSLAFKEPFVQLDMLPPGVQFGGKVGLDVNSVNLTAEGAMVLSVTEASGRFNVVAGASREDGTANLLAPLGITGIKLNEVGFIVGSTFAPPALKTGFGAKFQIGDQAQGENEIGMVLQVVPAVPAPIVNILQFAFEMDEISIDQAMTVFTNDSVSLPDELSVFAELRATDVGFFFCQAPTTLPDGSNATPGFGFNGSIDVFGFQAHAKLMVDALSGIEGHFQISPIELNIGDTPIISVRGNGLEITRDRSVSNSQQLIATNGAALTTTNREVVMAGGGPVFAFNTVGPRFVHGSLNIDFLDQAGVAIEGEISTDGITFSQEYRVSDILNIGWDFTLSLNAENPSLAASANFDLDLDIEIDFPDEFDLGTFRLDTAVHLNAALSASTEAFSLTFDGTFEFEGSTLTLPTLALNIPISTLTDIADRIIQQIKDNAEEIFADMFAEVREFFEDISEEIIAVGEGAIELAEDIGREAEAFAADVEEKAEELIDDVEEAADNIAEEAEEIGEQAVAVAEEGIAEVERIGQEMVDGVEQFGNEVVQFTQEAEAAIVQFGEDAEAFVNARIREIEELANEVAQEVERLANEAVRVVNEIIEDAEELAEDILQDLKNAAREIERQAAAVQREIEKVLKDIENFLTDVGNQIEKGVSDAGNTLLDAGETVVDGIGDAAGEVGDFFGSIF